MIISTGVARQLCISLLLFIIFDKTVFSLHLDSKFFRARNSTELKATKYHPVYIKDKNRELQLSNLREGPGWEFSSSCPYGLPENNVYVSPNGRDTPGYGVSTNFPYATVNYAVRRSIQHPCQTIFIMEGIYQNQNYGSSLHNNALAGMTGVRDLKITNYQDDKVILEFDGVGCFAGGSSNNPVQNLEISGVEIIGRNADISYAEAMFNRLINPKIKYYNGHGIAIWSGHHIYVHDIIVHHCPGSGIRVNKGDYVTFSKNVVFSNTWWTSSAPSAIVLATSISIDTSNEYKMFIVDNVVYDNVNKIPYYNPKYEWDYSPIGRNCGEHQGCQNGNVETCPWECRYGKAIQDYIIDGNGVYVTRNNNSYLYGKMELSFNTCFDNGINGVVAHRTDRVAIRDNIVFDNGVVPIIGKPEPEYQDWHEGCSGKSRQNFSGIVVNNAKNVQLWDNRVLARYNDDFAYKLLADGSPSPVENGNGNIVCRGQVGLIFPDIVRYESDIDTCIFEPPNLPSTQSCVNSDYLDVSSMPSQKPSSMPSAVPTERLSHNPSHVPSLSPSSTPSAEPTPIPSVDPTHFPSQSPSTTPTSIPSSAPTSIPSSAPSSVPSSAPTSIPSSTPSSVPSSAPTSIPSSAPTVEPSSIPSYTPTLAPSFSPSAIPSAEPTKSPSLTPSRLPSHSPSKVPSPMPSISPTMSRSALPTSAPSLDPATSLIPSATFSSSPTADPTESRMPTAAPSNIPTLVQSNVPSNSPTSHPSTFPSLTPTLNPSIIPSTTPTETPSTVPTQKPSSTPSTFPSVTPSTAPTYEPSSKPSASPSGTPTSFPSLKPSNTPSLKPSVIPSSFPTLVPSIIPTFVPSTEPSSVPSDAPTFLPSPSPSTLPSKAPSTIPTLALSTPPSISQAPSSLPTGTPVDLRNAMCPELSGVNRNQVSNADECASYCSNLDGCDLWQYCDSAFDSCPLYEGRFTEGDWKRCYISSTISSRDMCLPDKTNRWIGKAIPSNDYERVPLKTTEPVSSKRGFSGYLNVVADNGTIIKPVCNDGKVLGRGNGWYYTWTKRTSAADVCRNEENLWGATPNAAGVRMGGEFVPMLIGVGEAQRALDKIDLYRAEWTRANAHFLLGYNEPDPSPNHPHAVDPATAAIDWVKVQQVAASFDPPLRLVSPAPASENFDEDGVSVWLDEFLGNCTHVVPECDSSLIEVISFHDYKGDVDLLERRINGMSAHYGRPLWLTEYSIGRWTPSPLRPEQEDYMRASMTFLENHPAINRYVWFSSRSGHSRWGGVKDLIVRNVTGPIITTTGEIYRDWPEGPSTASTPIPSGAPTERPSFAPSKFPSFEPSIMPSLVPSPAPSSIPSTAPSLSPSLVPTAMPSRKPSTTPSTIPSHVPSRKPSHTPSSKPSHTPSSKPSHTPSSIPSYMPSKTPSLSPTSTPSNIPSISPSRKPSDMPSLPPSTMPSAVPTIPPSQTPSFAPSASPSVAFSSAPSARPRPCPSSRPTRGLTLSPTKSPQNPTLLPSKSNTTPVTNCKVWCPNHTANWSAKCNWQVNCAGCQEC